MNEESFKLTMEQEFQMRLIEGSAKKLSPEEAQEMIVQISRLLMVKDNVIKGLMKGQACHL